MKVELENVKPMEIEKRSFEIITEELGDTTVGAGNGADRQKMYPYKCRF